MYIYRIILPDLASKQAGTGTGATLPSDQNQRPNEKWDSAKKSQIHPSDHTMV